eukprot:scaffold176994_cov36-Tisochrysis_lutea.AAC.3
MSRSSSSHQLPWVDPLPPPFSTHFLGSDEEPQGACLIYSSFGCSSVIQTSALSQSARCERLIASHNAGICEWLSA